MTTAQRSSVEPITAKMRALVTPEILAEIGKAVAACTVDRTHDVPGVANRSKDGKTLYIDRQMPTTMKDGAKSYDPASTLIWHEIPEWVLMKHGVPYETAHSLATEDFEKPKVLSLGLNWDKYQEGMGGEIEANEKRDPKNPPPDIDLKPFQQSDEKHLKEIEADLKAAPKPMGGFRLTPVEHDPFGGAANG